MPLISITNQYLCKYTEDNAQSLELHELNRQRDGT